MDDSILNNIKQMLGYPVDFKDFDLEITMYINSAFSKLNSLGATYPGGFRIDGEQNTWAEFLKGIEHLDMIKEFIFIHVRLIHDPPTLSFVLNALQDRMKELEFRVGLEEITFNPNAYTKTPRPEWYIVDDETDFPAGSQVGDMGIDPDSGNVWQDA